ncbi:unnamed protein product [Rhizophagus irregularis]|nr:unnamed protein product [Rhizophagus irregularis]
MNDAAIFKDYISEEETLLLLFTFLAHESNCIETFEQKEHVSSRKRAMTEKRCKTLTESEKHTAYLIVMGVSMMKS